MNKVDDSFLQVCTPSDIPGLVCLWYFAQSADTYVSISGEEYVLRASNGPLITVDDQTAPLGGKAVCLKEGNWLYARRDKCPALNFSRNRSRHSLVAWIKREYTVENHCEFIAGQWNETNHSRQYGLFLNISVWGEEDQVCGHVSHSGGPSTGYEYCVDGAFGSTKVPRGQWSVVAMSFDGQQVYAWYNGSLDVRPGLNPYPFSYPLRDGGDGGSDFTVGAVDRDGKMGNFFNGYIAGLAVYSRSLTPGEMYRLSRL